MESDGSNGLQFGYDRKVSMLVRTGRRAEPFSQSLGSVGSMWDNQVKPRSVRGRRKPAFASISMAGTPTASASVGSAPMPMFMLASASESGAPAIDAPMWRLVLGNLAAGATAGCSVEAALYPIDTIKTRLQAMVGGGGFKALLDAGGGKGLYAGVWGNLAGTAPSSAIFISVYEPAKQWVEGQLQLTQQAHLAPLFAGAAAGMVSSIVRVPTEVIKQRLQTREFLRLGDAVGGILRKEGLKGMYAGYGAFLLRDLPFDAIEFMAYEQMKTVYSRTQNRDLYAAETSVIGAIAGGFTGLVTTPLDVLKTRLMTQGSKAVYKNTFDAALQILQKEGPGAFMSGWQPRLIWISLGGFVFFPVLEAAKKYYAPHAPAPPAAPPAAAPPAGKKGKKE